MRLFFGALLTAVVISMLPVRAHAEQNPVMKYLVSLRPEPQRS
jgi:hypothetical protein